jgi:hypothetical protein
MPSTPQAPAIFEHGDFARMSTAAPLWESRRGQIANLWLYAYCAILSPFILPVFYAAWRAVHTFWHRYELLPDRLRITTGLYRPHIATFDVDFDTVQSVRVEGFRLYRLINRGDVVLERGASESQGQGTPQASEHQGWCRPSQGRLLYLALLGAPRTQRHEVAGPRGSCREQRSGSEESRDRCFERNGSLKPVRIEGIKDPDRLKRLIEGTLDRWHHRHGPAAR